MGAQEALTQTHLLPADANLVAMLAQVVHQAQQVLPLGQQPLELGLGLGVHLDLRWLGRLLLLLRLDLGVQAPADGEAAAPMALLLLLLLLLLLPTRRARGRGAGRPSQHGRDGAGGRVRLRGGQLRARRRRQKGLRPVRERAQPQERGDGDEAHGGQTPTMQSWAASGRGTEVTRHRPCRSRKALLTRSSQRRSTPACGLRRTRAAQRVQSNHLLRGRGARMGEAGV